MNKFTEKQKIYLDTFLELMADGLSRKEARPLAREKAGYSVNTPYGDIETEEMAHEIVTRCNKQLAFSLPEALNKVDDVMDRPSEKGAAVQLAAALAILDRGGLAKKEAQEITIKAPTGLVFIPNKKPLDDEPTGTVEESKG